MKPEPVFVILVCHNISVELASGIVVETPMTYGLFVLRV